jgi:hypothetical protein
MSRFLLSFIIIAFISCSGTKHKVSNNTTLVPVITFDKETIDIGEIKRGEKRDITFNFTNTGGSDLEIELITACKCTSTDWTRGKIVPGGRGKISVTFESKNQAQGELKKTIDIISNTDPIVAECFFRGVIVN